MLGNPATIEAARIWHRRVWQVELFARGERTDAENWESLLDTLIRDRDRFYDAARDDLGITSGDIPHGDPWESEADLTPEPPQPPGKPSSSATTDPS